MLNRTLQPEIQPIASFALATPQKHTLKNGIPLKIFTDTNLNLLHLIIRVECGSLHETQKKIASVTYRMLKECHPTMNETETDDFFDFYGSSFNVSVGMMYASIEIVVPRQNCQKVFPVIMEILMTPQFKEENLTLFKEKSIQNLEYDARKTSFRNTQMMFFSMLGKDFACGKVLESSDYEIITTQQLQSYYDSTFCAENTRIYIAGNVTDDLAHYFETQFEQIPNKKAIAQIPSMFTHFVPEKIEEHWENAQQTSLSLCKPLFSIHHADGLSFYFMNTLFSNYFGSRLMQNLREKNGYTYSISGNNYFMGDSSIYCIECEVNNEIVNEAISACFDEMKKMIEEEVTDDELETVRNYLYGENLRSIDGVIAYKKKVMSWDDFKLEEQRYYDTLDVIKNIQAAEIRELADKYLQSDSFSIISIGK